MHQHVSVSTGALLVAAILASVGSVSQAAISNGDFSTGLTGWTSAGDVLWNPAQGNVLLFPPPGAAKVAEMTTIAQGVGPLSGTGAVSATTLESQLGLASGTLNSTAQGNVQEGSALFQSVTVNTGDKITFSYDFATQESSDPTVSKDFGFVKWGNTLAILPGATSTSTLTATGNPLFFNRESGWLTYTSPALPGGTYIIGFGVADSTFNVNSESALGIANVSIVPVPEPWAWSLVSGLALGGLALARRVRYNRA